MRWLGLLPLIGHVAAALYFFKIATIRIGFRPWWIAWGMLSSVAVAYSYQRLSNVLAGDPFVLENIAAPAYGALGMWLFAWWMWTIVKPKPIDDPKPVGLITLDWLGIIIDWNSTATELLGWTAADALGKEIPDLIIPEDLIVHYHGIEMSAREAHREGMRHLRNSGESQVINTRFNTTAMCKNGKHLPVEVRVTTHTSGMRQTFLGQIVLKPPVSM